MTEELHKHELYEWGRGQRILEKPRLLIGKKLKQIASGGAHSAALLESGSMYIWGDGRNGQLGLGSDVKMVTEPTLLPIDEKIVKIFCGYVQSAALTESNKLYVWGYDTFEGPIFTPTLMDCFGKSRISEIAFGPTVAYALILRSSFIDPNRESFSVVGLSEVKVWGISNKGMLGLGPNLHTQKAPASIPELEDKNIITLSVGEFHVAALSAKGTVYVWGNNQLRSIGVPIEESVVWYPTCVESLRNQHIAQILCGTNYTMALNDQGDLFSWGKGRHGVLGHGNEQSLSTPMRVNIEKIKGFTSGGLHTVAWTESGIIYSWGYGRGFKLGQTHDADILSPTIVETVTNRKIVIDIRCTFYSTLAFLEINIISITFNNQVRYLQVTKNMKISNIIEKASALFGIKKEEIEDLYLIDSSGSDYASFEEVNKTRDRHNNQLYLLRKDKVCQLFRDDIVFFDITDDEDNPMVHKATIDKLIDWLTYEFNSAGDFGRIFRNMYPNFISSHDLLSQLIERYTDPQIPPGIHKFMIPGIVRVTQLKIVNFIKKWIQNDDLFDELNIIEEINNFIEQHVADVYPTSSVNLRKILIEKFENIENLEFSVFGNYSIPLDLAPPPIPPQHNGAVDIFKYLPTEVARQITIIEYYDFFIKIKPKEIFNQSWTKKEKLTNSPNVIQMIKRFNNLSEWVAAEILLAESIEVRVRKAEVFIEIAEACMKLNNLNSLTSIVSAFTSSPIFRLKSIWDSPGISLKHRQILDELRSLVSLSMNMAKYREFIATAKPPLIPFIGIHLQDYTFLDDANPSYYDDKKRMINFSKWSKLEQIIHLIKRFQKTPYILTPVKPLLKYLYFVCGFQNHSESAYRFSKVIEANSEPLRSDPIIPPPPVVADEISKMYVSFFTTEDSHIRFLNQRSEIILGSSHTNLLGERQRLWKRITDKVSLDWKSLKPNKKTTSLYLRKETLLLDNRHKFNFREIATRSKLVELSIESALLHFPETEDEEKLLLKLLYQCFYDFIDSEQFLMVVKELSNTKLSKEQREVICKLGQSYKSITKTSRDNKLKYIDSSLRIRRESISSNERTNADTFMGLLESIAWEAEFLTDYHAQQTFVLQIVKDFETSLGLMNDPSFFSFSTVLCNIKQQISESIISMEHELEEVNRRFEEEKQEISEKIAAENQTILHLQEETLELEEQLRELNKLIDLEEDKTLVGTYPERAHIEDVQFQTSRLSKSISNYENWILNYDKMANVKNTLEDEVSKMQSFYDTELENAKQSSRIDHRMLCDTVEEQIQLVSAIKQSIPANPNHKEKKKRISNFRALMMSNTQLCDIVQQNGANQISMQLLNLQNETIKQLKMMSQNPKN